jgi:hypothetical protein
MNKPQYLYKTEDKFTIYEFVSEGPKGSIKKHTFWRQEVQMFVQDFIEWE